jgi:hypothetical protein
LTAYADDFPPVSPKILAAKTIAMRDVSSDTASFEYLYRALKKWGRWQIVGDENDADLVLAFASDEKGLGMIGIASTVSASAVPLLKLPRTAVLLDKDGRSLLQVVCEERILASSTGKCLAKRLRQRIEPK